MRQITPISRDAAAVGCSAWLALPPIQPELAIDVKVAMHRVVPDILAHADHEVQPSALAPIHDRGLTRELERSEFYRDRIPTSVKQLAVFA